MSEFLLGVIGVLVGSGATLFINWCQHRWETAKDRELDRMRKSILTTMLSSQQNEWRKLQTLARMIGANYETTTRLLVELGARGSETESEVWALQSRKPLS